MTLKYLQLSPGAELPDISAFGPFRSVVVIDAQLSPEWRFDVSTWLVKAGCLYMMAWGDDCSAWDDSVDMANLEQFNYQEVPAAQFVLTTWHEDEALEDVFWFAKNNAFHPVVEIKNTLILDISRTSREQDLLARYNKHFE